MRVLCGFFVLLLAGCASSSWEKYPPSLYKVLREETPTAVLKHELLLERVIAESEKSGTKPPPGVAAEYAYYCWRLGKQDVAKEALRQESEHYPESRQFLGIVDRFLPSVATVEINKDK